MIAATTSYNKSQSDMFQVEGSRILQRQQNRNDFRDQSRKCFNNRFF